MSAPRPKAVRREFHALPERESRESESLFRVRSDRAGRGLIPKPRGRTPFRGAGKAPRRG